MDREKFKGEFVLRVLGINQHILPQLTTRIHWPCYCTVHVYFLMKLFVAVYGFCEWKRIGAVFNVCLYMNCRWRSIYQRVCIQSTDCTTRHLCPYIPCKDMGFQRSCSFLSAMIGSEKWLIVLYACILVVLFHN